MLIFFSKGTTMKNFIQVTYKYKPNDKVANLTEVNDLLLIQRYMSQVEVTFLQMLKKIFL